MRRILLLLAVVAIMMAGSLPAFAVDEDGPDDSGRDDPVAFSDDGSDDSGDEGRDNFRDEGVDDFGDELALAFGGGGPVVIDGQQTPIVVVIPVGSEPFGH